MTHTYTHTAQTFRIADLLVGESESESESCPDKVEFVSQDLLDRQTSWEEEEEIKIKHVATVGRRELLFDCGDV